MAPRKSLSPMQSSTVLEREKSKGGPEDKGNDIDKLNAIVAAKMKDPKAGIEPEAALAVRNGAQVYHNRSRVMVYSYWVLAAYLLTQAPTVSYALLALFLSWISVDIYGAVLHVVLDHPGFINAPIVSTIIGENETHEIQVSHARDGAAA